MKSEFKKPCIIKDTTNTVLIMDDGFGYHLHGEFQGDISNEKYCVDSKCKNITREYLENTCGEVVSTEHVGFILELAKNAGFDTHYYMNLEPFDSGKGYMEVRAPKEYIYNDFVFTEDCLFIGSGVLPDDLACLGNPKSGKKQITIPLPPKADKQESREWPQIGDEVCWANGKRKGELKSIYGGWAWIKDDSGEFISLMAEFIKKPKTPEEELRDDLFNCKKPNLDTLQAEDLSRWFVANYDIKKKPQ